MEKKPVEKKSVTSSSTEERSVKRQRKLTEYGRQLSEKQKVKETYGMREKQFRRFYGLATKQKSATGETLLTLLERRLDNVVYRAKLATTRAQARQIIVHGHILLNGKKVYSPSCLIEVSDQISLANNVESKAIFLENVVDKRLNSGVKVPEWIEIDKKNRKANILRYPVRSDIQTPIEESLIVELYSK